MQEEPEQPDADTPQPKPRPTLTQQTYAGMLEQRLAQAAQEGLFENLPGAGKPQRLDDDANVPPDLRLGFRMLKSAGFAPPWLEARNDIELQQEELRRWRERINQTWETFPPAAHLRLRKEYLGKLQALRSAILTYNIRLPAGVPHLPLPAIEEEQTRLGS